MASFDPTTTLLVMALKEESQGLFEDSGIKPFYTGIGQVKATYSVTEAIEKTRPSSIINLGTAGSFHLNQGECVECLAFVQRPVLLNRFDKKFVNSSVKSKKILVPTHLTDLKKVVCGTADHIQNNADSENSNSYDIMDMEAYALAYVADQKKIPFYSIKYISDNSNNDLVLDWKKNLRNSAEKLLEIYKFIISSQGKS